MTTNLLTPPHVCPHCNLAIDPQPEPKGYPLVSTNGREQKVVDNFLLPAQSVYSPETQTQILVDQVLIICIEER